VRSVLLDIQVNGLKMRRASERDLHCMVVDALRENHQPSTLPLNRLAAKNQSTTKQSGVARQLVADAPQPFAAWFVHSCIAGPVSAYTTIREPCTSSRCS
jgi:hypothetical protein